MPATDLQIRVFLVDHNHLYRASIRSELGRILAIAGQTGSAQKAIEQILRSRPTLSC